jgi:hypothetical protein
MGDKENTPFAAKTLMIVGAPAAFCLDRPGRPDKMSGMDARSGRRGDLFGAALYYGAIWGLGEAILGHLLHLARVPGLPGLVMVPFAVAVMGRAAARSRSAAAVLLAGAVAASFKLLDLLVPGTGLPALVHPVQAILLEALAGAIWVGSRRTEGVTSPALSAGPVGHRSSSAAGKT